jgi:hypothetical protein
MANAISHCKSCASLNLVELNAEICFKFPGVNGLKSDPIFAFLKLAVCLDCGLLQSTLSTGDLRRIRESARGGEDATT